MVEQAQPGNVLLELRQNMEFNSRLISGIFPKTYHNFRHLELVAVHAYAPQKSISLVHEQRMIDGDRQFNMTEMPRALVG